MARTIHIYGVDTACLAQKSPNIRSYTVAIYSSLNHIYRVGLAVDMHRIFGEFPAKNSVYTPYIYQGCTSRPGTGIDSKILGCPKPVRVSETR